MRSSRSPRSSSSTARTPSTQAWQLAGWLASRLGWTIQASKLRPNVEIAFQSPAPHGPLRLRIDRLAEGPSELRRVRVACTSAAELGALDITVEDGPALRPARGDRRRAPDPGRPRQGTAELVGPPALRPRARPRLPRGDGRGPRPGPGRPSLAREVPREDLDESPELAEAFATGDPNAAITRFGLAGTDPNCVATLDLFASIYGAEAGNLALKCMATNRLRRRRDRPQGPPRPAQGRLPAGVPREGTIRQVDAGDPGQRRPQPPRPPDRGGSLRATWLSRNRPGALSCMVRCADPHMDQPPKMSAQRTLQDRSLRPMQSGPRRKDRGIRDEPRARPTRGAPRGTLGWRRWGPYVSERAWATVREDYSADGDAWGYFPHDQARSKAYRWGEDGIAGDLRPLPAPRLRAGLLERRRPDPQGAAVRPDVRTRATTARTSRSITSTSTTRRPTPT